MNHQPSAILQPTTNNQRPSTNNQQLWPHNAPFALFLSHDIDQIHDRELFRILADLNHVRRMWTQGEKGNTALALRRVGRALFSPKPPERDFETILEIEARYGFRSTFFVLHDPYWSRQGPRYTLQSAALHRIIRMIQAAGCEVGLHGGYYRFNQPALYRESRLALQEALGVDAVGIRNHLLRFSYPETWLAQEAAGFKYDATFGHPDQLGPRGGRMFPFLSSTMNHEPSTINHEPSTLLVLPLTVMDVTLFRSLGLTGQQALDAAWGAITPVIQAGGLVSLLWHNNYFNEPEYRDWQWVYEQLLSRLAALKPWCGTGKEIVSCWS